MTLWQVHCGDARRVLPRLAPNSIDALVTDPPAGVSFMGRAWDGDKGGRRQWVAWLTGIMRAAWHAMRPGAHGVVWALPRTSHWTAWALEDAGFEIRDSVHHVFGTGFPKSLDLSKAIDATLLHGGSNSARVRAVNDTQAVDHRAGGAPGLRASGVAHGYKTDACIDRDSVPVTEPETAAAARWEGWGTSLKPAHEVWWVVRKPVTAGASIAENVLEHGVGGVNVEGCRVGSSKRVPGSPKRAAASEHTVSLGPSDGSTSGHDPNTGRWPPNLVLSHRPDCGPFLCAADCAVRALDEQSGEITSGSRRAGYYGLMGYGGHDARPMPPLEGSSGGASRFFPCFRYVAKPGKAERDAGIQTEAELIRLAVSEAGQGLIAKQTPRKASRRRNTHPTVKPVELMRWLARLVTPPGGVVLDPFTGSGTTGIAAVTEGFEFMGIERSPKYARFARQRIARAAALAAGSNGDERTG